MLLTLLIAAGAPVCEPDSLLENATREYRRVALTFDACSSGEYRFDKEVYDVLETMKVRATIFLGGEWTQRQRRNAHMIQANPLLEVATHGYHHKHMTKLSAADVAWEIQEGQRAIFNELGIWPTLFRAPYGEINKTMIDTTQHLGVTLVQFDLPSGDPDPLLKPEKIVRWVVDGSKGGSVVVLHINKNGVHTAKTLPEIVGQLRARGFELVTVSELLNRPVTFTDGAFCYDPISEQSNMLAGF